MKTIANLRLNFRESVKYGKHYFYPSDEQAAKFCAILRQKSATPDDIKRLQEFGEFLGIGFNISIENKSANFKEYGVFKMPDPF